MKRIFSIILALSLIVVAAFSFVSCGGKDGVDGVTPTIEISEDGYWVINGIKSNVKAAAQDGSIDENPQQLDFYPTDDGSYYVSVGKAKYLSHITIPETFNGAPVVGIAPYAFRECENLISVTIPDSVKSIGDEAFSYCISLASITIPDSVTSIGTSAFCCCHGLTSVTIGNGVESIGGGAFDDCTSLASVTIGDSVTSIGNWAFYNCSSLASVTIPDSVKSIGISAFSGCTGLTSVTIGNGVESIGDYAFYDCTGLASVTIGNGVESIGDWAFDSCTSLTSIKYRGTEEQWAAVSKSKYGIGFSDHEITYNYTGD